MEFMNKKKPSMPTGFEPIRSAEDDRAYVVTIRELIKITGGSSFCVDAVFLEASMEDLRAKGGKMCGRCCMHPEAAVGIKTYGLKVPVAVPCSKDCHRAVNGSGYRYLTKEEIKEACNELKKVKYLIGFNMNGSTIGKCITTAEFLRLGIRCRLESNGLLLVDNWPDYDECYSAMTEFQNKYNVGRCLI